MASQSLSRAGADSTEITTVPSTSPLLRLPWELRQHIWKFSQPSDEDLEFDMRHPISRHRHALQPNQIPYEAFHGPVAVPKNLRPLLYVNRQISTETLALPKAGWTLNLCTFYCMQELLGQIKERQLKQTRSVCVLGTATGPCIDHATLIRINQHYSSLMAKCGETRLIKNREGGNSCLEWVRFDVSHFTGIRILEPTEKGHGGRRGWKLQFEEIEDEVETGPA